MIRVTTRNTGGDTMSQPDKFFAKMVEYANPNLVNRYWQEVARMGLMESHGETAMYRVLGVDGWNHKAAHKFARDYFISS